MTTREISEITGMDIKTVAKAVRKLLPEKITKKGTETIFTEAEGMVLLKGVKKRNLIEIQPRSNGVSPRSNGVSSDMADMREMVKELCGTVRDVLRSLKPGEAAPTPAQIEAPKMTDRAELRQIVAKYAKDHGGDYPGAWGLIYGAAYYRLKINFKLRSERAGKPPLEIAEEEGLIPQLVAIAREVLK